MSGVDMAEMRRLRGEGLITIRPHPELPIDILNYTPRCQHDGIWTPETLMCRGLVVERDGTIVARPFPKFFNWEEHEGNPDLPRIDWDQGFVATEKLDGSLIVGFHYAGGWHMATRGSFASPQADEARAIWRDNGHRSDRVAMGRTYLFEVISPATRVVVDYGDARKLVLLEVMDTANGRPYLLGMVEMAASLIGCPAVGPLVIGTPSPDSLAEFRDRVGPDAEGIVIRFDDGLRVKAKFAEYRRLHRLVTMVTSRTIWEHLRDGRPLAEILDRVPGEFSSWVGDVIDMLREDYNGLMWSAHDTYVSIRTRLGGYPRRDAASRKAYAAEFSGHPEMAAILFRMLDDRPYDDILWKAVKPESSRPFRPDES